MCFRVCKRAWALHLLRLKCLMDRGPAFTSTTLPPTNQKKKNNWLSLSFQFLSLSMMKYNNDRLNKSIKQTEETVLGKISVKYHKNSITINFVLFKRKIMRNKNHSNKSTHKEKKRKRKKKKEKERKRKKKKEKEKKKERINRKREFGQQMRR